MCARDGECRWVEYEWVQAVRTDLQACKHTPTEARPQLKRGKHLNLTLFWDRLRNGWVGKIFSIVIFAACIGGLKWMRTRDSTHSSLNVNHCGNRLNTHAAHKLWGMRSHHAHSLSAESEAVSSECDNREWRCVPVSGHWLKKEACLWQASACSQLS